MIRLSSFVSSYSFGFTSPWLVTLLRWVGVRFVNRADLDETALALSSRYGAALFNWCVRLLSMSVFVEGEDCLMPGPLGRLRASRKYRRCGASCCLVRKNRDPVHYVLKTELKVEPCIDILGSSRLHAFIDRHGPPVREQRKIGSIAGRLGDHAIVLFRKAPVSAGPNKRAKSRS